MIFLETAKLANLLIVQYICMEGSTVVTTLPGNLFSHKKHKLLTLQVIVL